MGLCFAGNTAVTQGGNGPARWGKRPAAVLPPQQQGRRTAHRAAPGRCARAGGSGGGTGLCAAPPAEGGCECWKHRRTAARHGRRYGSFWCGRVRWRALLAVLFGVVFGLAIQPGRHDALIQARRPALLYYRLPAGRRSSLTKRHAYRQGWPPAAAVRWRSPPRRCAHQRQRVVAEPDIERTPRASATAYPYP